MAAAAPPAAAAAGSQAVLLRFAETYQQGVECNWRQMTTLSLFQCRCGRLFAGPVRRRIHHHRGARGRIAGSLALRPGAPARARTPLYGSSTCGGSGQRRAPSRQLLFCVRARAVGHAAQNMRERESAHAAARRRRTPRQVPHPRSSGRRSGPRYQASHVSACTRGLFCAWFHGRLPQLPVACGGVFELHAPFGSAGHSVCLFVCRAVAYALSSVCCLPLSFVFRIFSCPPPTPPGCMHGAALARRRHRRRP